MAKAEFKNDTVLRPYQRRWANDPARFAFSVKSAQIGYSTGSAAWAVERCLRIPRRTVVFLSKSKPQARELGDKAKLWIDGYRGVASEYFPNEAVLLGDTEETQHRIEFPNGSRILVLAANPDTARGYTGDVVLDEFAFHKDAEKIFTAVFRQTTLGYSMRVLSTPNGQQGKFYQMAKSLGLDLGIRPRRQPTHSESGQWSGHWCDIHLACEEGFPVKPAEVKAAALEAGGDEDTWLQEYCCQFLSQASQWISAELFQSAVSSDAVAEGFRVAIAEGSSPAIYCGWDVARRRDLSVLWFAETVGDVTWTRGIIELRNMPTPDQLREARRYMPFLRRMNIDATGMGLAIFEQLEREFPGKVEGVTFTAPIKEQLAVLGKRRMEENKVRVPDSDMVRNSFRSVKKSTNSIGQARFDSEHDTKYGHADHWWAYCLAEAAADRPVHHLDEGAMVGVPRAGILQPEALVGAEF